MKKDVQFDGDIGTALARVRLSGSRDKYGAETEAS